MEPLLISEISIKTLKEKTFERFEEPLPTTLFTNFGCNFEILHEKQLRVTDEYGNRRATFFVAPISKPCPHGSKAKRKKRLNVKFAAIAQDVIALCDDVGRLWKLDLHAAFHGGDEETVVEVKRLTLAKNLICQQICAGRCHFLALVRRRRKGDAHEDEDDESEFYCDACRESNHLRLSTLMLEADKIAEEKVLNEEANRISRLSSVVQTSRFRCSNDVFEEEEDAEEESTGEQRRGSETEPQADVAEEAITSRNELSESFCSLNEDSLGKDAISLPDAESSHFTFVSMDRISIREQLSQQDDVGREARPRITSSRSKEFSFESLEMNESHEVWAWGSNELGQLGHGDTVARLQPFRINALSGEFVNELCCGEHFSLARTACGEVFTWGQNIFGQAEESAILNPRSLRIGADQFAYLVRSSASHAAVQIVSLKYSTSVLLMGNVLRSDQPSILRAPLSSKDHIPIKVDLDDSTVWVSQAKKTTEVSQLLILFHESCKQARLVKHLWIIFSSMQHSFKRPKEGMALEMLNLLKNLAQTLEQYFHCMCSVLNDVSRQLQCAIVESKKLKAFLSILSSPTCVDLLRRCIEEYVYCEAFVQFSKITLKSSVKGLLSRTALEFECDSTRLDTQLAQLFARVCDWTSRLVDFSRSLATSTGDDTQNHNNFLINAYQQVNFYLKQRLKWAQQTRKYWKADVQIANLYCQPKRLLVDVFRLGDKLKRIDSTTRTFLSTLLRSAASIVVFNDLLVINETKNVQSHALKLVWLERRSDDDGRVAVRIATPEVDYDVEFVDDESLREFQTACNAWREDVDAPSLEVPTRRRGEHFFSPFARPAFRGAHYDGEWKRGKLDGRGTLTLVSGEIVKGSFRNDLAHGFCILLRPSEQAARANVFSVFYYQTPAFDKSISYDVFRGVYDGGELNSLAQIRFANGDSYDGYSKGSVPHGFGIFRSARGETYVGDFKDGAFNGYGVYVTNKRKYLGEWKDGDQTGVGTSVDINGCFRQGEWVSEQFRKGHLVCPSCQEPDSFIEFVGEMNGEEIAKGELRLTKKLCLRGTFSGNIYQGRVQVQDAQLIIGHPIANEFMERLHSADSMPENKQWTYPLEKRWSKMLEIFQREELGSVDDFDTTVAIVWSNLVSSMRIGKQLVSGDVSTGFCDALETIPKFDADWDDDYYQMVAEYWRLSLDNSYHPLYRIFHGCAQVFNTSYSGMAAHKNLHVQALHELRHLIKRVYDIVRKLFPSLPEDECELACNSEPADASGSSSSDVTPEASPAHRRRILEKNPRLFIPACNFVYEDFFAHCSPVIFTICSLASSQIDDVYWSRVVYLNAHTDMKLLSYLEVPRDLWPIDIPMEMADLDKPNKRSVARNKFYQPAVVGLQHMSTHQNPVEKLNSLHETFDLIQKCVCSFTEKGVEHIWNCDDLLPAFMYVVIRAQIKNLGAEIEIIDHFTSRFRSHLQADMMFTMLHSAYIQICCEKSLV